MIVMLIEVALDPGASLFAALHGYIYIYHVHDTKMSQIEGDQESIEKRVQNNCEYVWGRKA